MSVIDYSIFNACKNRKSESGNSQVEITPIDIFDGKTG